MVYYKCGWDKIYIVLEKIKTREADVTHYYGNAA